MNLVVCPICESIIYAIGVEQHEVISCQECGSKLVIEEIIKDVIFLKLAPEVEEDWGE